MDGKFKKKDFIYCGIIICIILIIIIYMISGGHMYGSMTDWETQHWAIPEYFRILFYDTHQLFPSFAFNLGAGENIYNFSYYGLLSPIVILSYCMPFITMANYIQISSVIIVLASICLFYKWLLGKFKSEICFTASFLFACASPLLFHSHRHIMFIDYMPFLILAFMGVDAFIIKGKKNLLIISLFLVIMTSYFFSVGSIFALTVYAIVAFIENNKKFEIRAFVKKGLQYSFCIVISILMSCVLLLPTMYSLLSGRSKTNSKIDYFSILLPGISVKRTLYYSYSIGVTAVLFIAIIYFIAFGYKKNKSNFYLAIVMAIVNVLPVFAYVLNGMMYLDGKAMIPFLPVAGYLIASFYNNIVKGQYVYKKFVVLIAVCNLLLLIIMDKEYCILYFIDVMIFVGAFSIYHYIKKEKIKFKIRKMTGAVLVVPVMTVSLIVCVFNNLQDNLVDKKEFNDSKKGNINSLINKAMDSEQSIYRISNNICIEQNTNRIYNINDYSTGVYSSVANSYYKDFYFNEICNNNPYRNAAILSHSDNILFNLYMGNKYIISKEFDMKGYEKVASSGDINLYENKSALPIGYASSRIMGQSDYDMLSYPYTVEALLKCTVVDDSENSMLNKTKLSKVNISDFNKKADTSDLHNVTLESNNDSKKLNISYDSGYSNMSQMNVLKKSNNNLYFSATKWNPDIVLKADDNVCLENVDEDKVRVDIKASDSVIKEQKSLDNYFGQAKFNFDEDFEDKLILIKFGVDNSIFSKNIESDFNISDVINKKGKCKGDAAISINGIKNKLTVPTWKYYNNNESFEYVISSNNKLSSLNIDFFYGIYDIFNLETYTLNYSDIENVKNNIDEFIINKEKTKGDIICGDINVSEDSYFRMSIPYDKGFSIIVDGEKTQYEKVDTSFIGFPIEKGNHNVTIQYESPMLKEGKVCSLVGVIGYIFLFIVDYIKKKRI